MESRFDKFNSKDYAIVEMEQFGDGSKIKTKNIAEIILKASCNCKKPINFRMKNKEKYDQTWAVSGRFVDVISYLQNTLGYGVRQKTNPKKNGNYLLLRKLD